MHLIPDGNNFNFPKQLISIRFIDQREKLKRHHNFMIHFHLNLNALIHNFLYDLDIHIQPQTNCHHIYYHFITIHRFYHQFLFLYLKH